MSADIFCRLLLNFRICYYVAEKSECGASCLQFPAVSTLVGPTSIFSKQALSYTHYFLDPPMPWNPYKPGRATTRSRERNSTLSFTYCAIKDFATETHTSTFSRILRHAKWISGSILSLCILAATNTQELPINTWELPINTWELLNNTREMQTNTRGCRSIHGRYRPILGNCQPKRGSCQPIHVKCWPIPGIGV